MRLLLVALASSASASPELKPVPTADESDAQPDLLRKLASRNLYHEHTEPDYNW